MTTTEKLVVKIFERKNSIIEKVRQQTESYSQYAASKLLIDGITPPAWFWSPDRLSDSKELNKEDVIKILLCPSPQPPVGYSAVRLPSYDALLSRRDDEHFADGVSKEDMASREAIKIVDSLTLPAQDRGDHEGCPLMLVTQTEESISATENRTDEKIFDVGNAPEKSLLTIQRSKSRQKAIEIRNSVKGLAKSGSSHEKVSDLCSSELKFALSAANQDPDEELQNLPEPYVLAGRNYEGHDLEKGKFRSSEKIVDPSSVRFSLSKNCAGVSVSSRGSLMPGCSCEDLKVSFTSPLAVVSTKGSNLISASGDTGNSAGKLPQGAGPPTFCCQISGSKNGGTGLCISCSSPHQQKCSCVSDISGVDVSVNYAKGDSLIITPSSGISAQHVDLKNVPASVMPSGASFHLGAKPKTLRNASNTYEQDNYNDIQKSTSPVFDELPTNFSSKPVTQSHCTHCDPDACMDAGVVIVDDGLALKDRAAQGDISNPSRVKQTAESERQTALTPSNCFVLENKELPCIISEEYGLKDATSVSGKRSPFNLETIGSLLLHPKLSLGKATSDADQLCPGNHWPESAGISDKNEEGWRDSAEAYDHQNPDAEHEKSEPLLSELLKTSQDYVDASLDRKLSEAYGIGSCSEIKKVETNRSNCAILDNIKQFPAQESPFSCIEGDVSFQLDDLPLRDCDLVTYSGCRSFGNNLPIYRKFRSTSIGSWPHLKKRKTEDQQKDKFCSSLSFWVRKPHSYQGGSPGRCLQSIELNPDAALVDRCNNSFDDGTCPEIKTNLMEVTGSSFSSQCKELQVGLAYNKNNKLRSSSDSVRPQKIEGAITPGLTEDANNSGSCVGEGIRALRSNSNNFYSTGLGNGQDNQHSCNLHASDNLNSEKAARTMKMIEGSMSPDLIGQRSDSVFSPGYDDLVLLDDDDSMPLFEGFLVDAQTERVERDFDAAGIDFDKLNFPTTTIERASFLAEICRSASMITPSSHISSAIESQKIFHSVPKGFLEHMTFGNTLPLNLDLEKPLQASSSLADDYNFAFDQMPYFDSLTNSGSRYGSSSRNLHASPVGGKLRERFSLHTGSSGMSLSSNPELTCFPIEEDPSNSEENTLPLNLDLENPLQASSSLADDYNFAFDRMPYFDSLTNSGSRYGSSSRNLRASPVGGKLRKRFSLHTGSSGKSLSSNPELTCFRIEEDPSNSEENIYVEEHEDYVHRQADSALADYGDKRQPLKVLKNLDLDSSLTIKKKDEIPLSTKDQGRDTSATSKLEDSCIGVTRGRKTRSTSVVTTGTAKAKKSASTSICKAPMLRKPSLKIQEPKNSLKQSQGNTIVSNIRSFIPMLQRKPAASICAGKRAVKVKALEAAETSKRLAEKKENERNMKKEALKLERANHMRLMELEKKKLEDERKKKAADNIVKKRLREEGEKKEKDSKRLRLETRQKQENKVRVEKVEKEQPPKNGHTNSKKESHNVLKIQPNKKGVAVDETVMKMTEPKLIPSKVMLIFGECGTSGQSLYAEKAINPKDKSPKNENFVCQNVQAKSYEISPYRCSDDEEDEIDELPTKKYIPEWGSINKVVHLLPLQQEMDPNITFPRESFCSIDEALLPRKLYQKRYGIMGVAAS